MTVFICTSPGFTSLYIPKKAQESKDLDDFVNQLPRSVLTDIEKYIKGLPKLITTVEFVCEKCGHHNKYVLEGFQDFFV